MKAFHNDPAIKQKYIDMPKADFKNGVARELGISIIIAGLSYEIFRWLSPMMESDSYIEFRLKFLESINIGADLSKIFYKMKTMI